MRRSVLAGAFLAVLAAPLPALAQQSDDQPWNGGFDQKNERRSDFVFGLSPSFALMAADGYPNEIAKINDPAYKATSGLAYGPACEAWIGGALRDWFSFGVGAAYLQGGNASTLTTGGAFLVRIEAFPFYRLGLKDLALFANFGAGGLSLHGEDHKHAAAGFASVGGGGVAYELARVGHFAFAPTAEYLLVASQSLSASQALIGARVVFYGGPG
ncbi:MAG TPA: hypothetical protein VMI54_30790 [Polyangiaceae bacterium]|nr:hypothetical protein [Polyangiaceae bacterium]